MNQVSPGLLQPVGLEALRARLVSVVKDPTTATAVSISTPTAFTADRAAGTWTTTDTTDNTTGLLRGLTAAEVASSAGLYSVDDQRLRVMAADVTIPPTTDTRFTAGSVSYAVVRAELGTLGLQWVLIGRAVS